MTRRRVWLLVAAVVTALAALTPVLLPGSAGARGRSTKVAFRDASIPTLFKDGIASSARLAGVDLSSLVEVAPSGNSPSRAGFVLGRGRPGDMVSFLTAQSFTNFRAVGEVSNQRELTVVAAAQPDKNGDTGHVQLLGIAAPDVTRATLELNDGSAITVELVRVGTSGYSFFTYVTDDPPTFPRSAHVYDAAGAERQHEDLASAIAPPKNVS